jgi:hypothetical protein
LIRSFIVKHLFLNFLIYLEINAFKINEIHKSFNLNT